MSDPLPVAGIILAAGESSRMGRDKALLPIGAETFIERLLGVLDGIASPIVIILGHHGDEIEPKAAAAVERTRGARIVHNHDYKLGQLSSLKAGLRALADEHVAGALLCLVDHPAVSRSIVEQVRNRLVTSGAPLVIPSHQNRRGHPVGFAARLFPELLAAPVTEGARSVVAAHEKDISYVETDDESVLWDIDRPEDYQELMRRWTPASQR